MPIIKSAKKALRASARKRVENDRRRDTLKKAVKETRKRISDKKVKEAEATLARAYQAIDKAAKRGIIKKNAAARKKSRLAKAIAKAGKSA